MDVELIQCLGHRKLEDVFLQNLAMKSEITISRCLARAQQEWDEDCRVLPKWRDPQKRQS